MSPPQTLSPPRPAGLVVFHVGWGSRFPLWRPLLDNSLVWLQDLTRFLRCPLLLFRLPPPSPRRRRPRRRSGPYPRSSPPSSGEDGGPSYPTPPSTPPPTRTPTPSSGRKKLCSECRHEFSYKNYADHVKCHALEGDEGAPAKPCKQCRTHPEMCRVAINPKRMGTYACVCCIKGHKSCEHTAHKVRGGDGGPDRHPMLLEDGSSPSNGGSDTHPVVLGDVTSSSEEVNHGTPVSVGVA
ncbi:hypothetical protein FPOAC1_004368 [Fusarium poae]|uniref:hypothetical protein n=1 Tax=Fusarium poae TaxID=36050 RepID=UPI001CEB5B6A|nr:hypothetical protein FPOAC1_004368 [Fusarium poae]KAG8671129.1 hypothetical protein FPOAC1_004368 [Fusarium poae]